MKIATCFTIVFAATSFLAADEAITPVDPQLGRPVDFYQDVYPILESKCLACHSAAVKEGDLVLESAELILKGGASGESVVPNKPDDSYLFTVAARIDEPVMPPLPNKVQAKALTPKEVGILKQWILEGAKAGERQIDNSIAWQPVAETYKAVYSLALGPNNRFIYAGRGNRIFVYDLVTQTEVARLSDPALLSLRQDGQAVYGPGVAHRDFVHSLAVSPNGKQIASGGYRVVKLWEHQQPRQLANLQLPANVKQSITDASGNWGAFLLENNQIQLWNLANGQAGTLIAADDQKLTSITFGPEGKTIVAGTEAGALRISNVSDGATKLGFNIGSPISAVAAVSDAGQVLTAGADNVIRVWNWADVQQPTAEGAEPAKAVFELAGHSQPATSLTVFAEKKEVLSGSKDATVRVWNLADGKQVFSQSVGAPVTATAMTADGQFIVGAGENKVSTIWSRDGKKVADIKGNQQLAMNVKSATDNQTVAKAQFALADQALKDAEKDLTQREESLKKANEQKEKVTKELADADTKLTEAKTKAEEAAKALEAKPEDAAAKKAKEDADKALTAAEDARKKAMDAVTSANRAIELSQQSIETAKKNVEGRKTAKTAAEEKQKAADVALAAANAAVEPGTQIAAALNIAADGKTLITSGAGQPVQQWSLTTGEPVGVLDLGQAATISALLSTNGSLIGVSSANQATSWDIADQWTLTATIGVDSAAVLDVSKSQFEDRVTALAFSPDGNLLATGGGEPSRNGELMIWNVAERKLVRTIEEAHSDSIADVEFSRDGQLLVSGAADKFVKVFHVNDGSLLRSYEGHTDHVLGVAFKADQSSLASAGADKAIKIWNTETGEQRRTISNYSKQVTCVDYVGVSDNLISGSGDKNVKYHTASNGRNYRSFGGNGDFVYQAISTGDEGLVISAGEDGGIRVWNGKDGKLITTFTEPQPATETASR